MALTIESAGALVPGAPVPQPTRQVRVLRPFFFGGEAQAVGDLVPLPHVLAVEMIAAGKAEAVDDAELQQAAAEIAAITPPAGGRGASAAK